MTNADANPGTAAAALHDFVSDEVLEELLEELIDELMDELLDKLEDVLLDELTDEELLNAALLDDVDGLLLLEPLQADNIRAKAVQPT